MGSSQIIHAYGRTGTDCYIGYMYFFAQPLGVRVSRGLNVAAFTVIRPKMHANGSISLEGNSLHLGRQALVLCTGLFIGCLLMQTIASYMILARFISKTRRGITGGLREVQGTGIY